MTDLARNAPCHCGSGEKYKKCCLPLAPIAMAQSAPAKPLDYVKFRPRDEDRALQELMLFAARPEFEEDMAAAQLQFADSTKAMDTTWDDPTARMGFVAWSLFDFAVRGRTFCDRILETRGMPLAPAERRYLESMRDTRMGLYEVEEVRVVAGLTLLDCLTGERFEVAPLRDTEHLSAGSILAARISIGAGGAHKLDGTTYLFETTDVHELVRALRAAQSSGRLKEEAAVIINRRFLEVSRGIAPPSVLTSEGHEVAFTRTIFSTTGDVTQKLVADSRFTGDGADEFVWLESSRSSRVLGSVRLDGNTLVLETMSNERAQKGRKILAKLLGESANFVRVESELLDISAPATFEPTSESLSLDELEALGDFLGSDDGGDDRLPMVACEGFFAALHSGPEMISATEWLPVVLGEAAPAFASADEAQTTMSLLMRYYNAVGAAIAGQDEDFEPAIGDEHGKLSVGAAIIWAMGYTRAISLRAGAWEAFITSDEGDILAPIVELAMIGMSESRKRIDTKANRRLAEDLAASAMEVFDYWFELARI